MRREGDTWGYERSVDEEDYLMFGEPTPPWDVREEEWERRDRAARHYDFVFRQPARVSDDWGWEMAA